MISFKGILKYSIYLFIAGWMFLLGIMVGRGNSPVTFDTEKFQKRLETIAQEFGERTKDADKKKKIDLKFYDILDQPAPEEGPSPEKHFQEIIPKKEAVAALETNSAKTSMKRQTFKKPVVKKQAPAPVKTTKETTATKTIKATTTTKAIKAKKSEKILPGKYTVQIAAYKEFKDAVTQMAILEKKGFSSYRVKGEKDGVTWYRVRSGSFATYDEAKKFKQKLEKVKIKSMILNKN